MEKTTFLKWPFLERKKFLKEAIDNFLPDVLSSIVMDYFVDIYVNVVMALKSETLTSIKAQEHFLSTTNDKVRQVRDPSHPTIVHRIFCVSAQYGVRRYVIQGESSGRYWRIIENSRLVGTSNPEKATQFTLLPSGRFRVLLMAEKKFLVPTTPNRRGSKIVAKRTSSKKSHLKLPKEYGEILKIDVVGIEELPANDVLSDGEPNLKVTIEIGDVIRIGNCNLSLYGFFKHNKMVYGVTVGRKGQSDEVKETELVFSGEIYLGRIVHVEVSAMMDISFFVIENDEVDVEDFGYEIVKVPPQKKAFTCLLVCGSNLHIGAFHGKEKHLCVVACSGFGSDEMKNEYTGCPVLMENPDKLNDEKLLGMLIESSDRAYYVLPAVDIEAKIQSYIASID